ncbi:unnamed protein product [Rhodiola kirilowii]
MRAKAFKEIQVLGVQGRRGVLGTWRMMEMTFLDPRRCIIKCFEIEVFRVNGIEGKLEA